MNDEQKKEIVIPTGQMGAPAVGRGHEDHLEQDDYEIPRAKIVQFTSEETSAPNEADRIPAGRFINGLSKTEIPPVFVPVYRWKTYTRWNPRKKDDPNYDPAFEPGALIWTTHDRHDPRVVSGISFGPNNEAPAVTQSINFLCYFQDQKIPLVLTFSKTSFRGGRRLNTLLMESGGDMFSNKFKLVFTQQENAGTKYYVMDVRANGKATPEEFLLCEKWFTEFRGKDLSSRVQKETHEETKPADKWEE